MVSHTFWVWLNHLSSRFQEMKVVFWFFFLVCCALRTPGVIAHPSRTCRTVGKCFPSSIRDSSGLRFWSCSTSTTGKCKPYEKCITDGGCVVDEEARQNGICSCVGVDKAFCMPTVSNEPLIRRDLANTLDPNTNRPNDASKRFFGRRSS